MSGPSITFSPDAASGGTGWFDFNPERMGWSFEETLARINGLTLDQNIFDTGGDGKSLFTVFGYLFTEEGSYGSRFQLYDKTEDRRIHVMFAEEGRPQKLSKNAFVQLLRDTLAKALPKEFDANYFAVTNDRVSWPPVPSKEDAVAMAVDSFTEIILWSKGKHVPLDEALILSAEKALKALGEAF